VPVETRIREAFAAAVKAVLGEVTYNQAAYKTGLSDEYIRKMARGRVPSEAVLQRFAEGLGADLQALRVAAGYERPTDPVERVEFALSGVDHLEDYQAEHLVRMIKQLAEKKKEGKG
jgi:transcriptional regulator with XRE-family HTH domain